MSIHKSLVSKNKLVRQRSVLTRDERIKVLQEDGRWNDGDSVFGLPKVRVYVTSKIGKKQKKDKETAADASGTGETAAEAAPAPEGEKK
jgi:small basic protein (TIGR04137 family)